MRHPVDWSRVKRDGVLRLSSADSSAGLAVSAPVAGSHGSRVRRDSVSRLLKAYAPAEVVGRTRTRLDGRRVAATEILGVARSGKPIRILSLVGATPKRTYSIALFTDVDLAPRRYVEAQSIIHSLRFAQP